MTNLTVDLVHSLAWPIVVLTGILVLWWSGALRELLHRTTKISVFQVSLEFATVMRPALPGLEQLRDPVPSEIFQSGGSDLVRQLLSADKIDYALIDLRDGRSWLASRLYIFVELLRRQRGLRCIVFVERGNGLGGQFVGLADPTDVILAMASRFPWLEMALTDAYYGGMRPLPAGLWAGARLDPTIAEQVARNFLSHPNIQWSSGEQLLEPWQKAFAITDLTLAPWAGDRAPILLKSPEAEWVKVSDQSTRYEHARWLTGRFLNDTMGAQKLRQDDWIFEKAGHVAQQQSLAVLGRAGSDFVAVVNDDRNFRRLLERRLVLEKLAEEEIRNYGQ